MKRKWRIWTLVLLMGIISTYSFAAGNNPLLPADHWAYEAMAELARDGLLDKNAYWDNPGSELLTRYEMAYYLKQLLLHLDKKKDEIRLTDYQVKLLNRLMDEFQNELDTLGINLTDLGNMAPALPDEHETVNNEGFYDLDYILSNNSSADPEPFEFNLPTDISEPYYFMGEYFSPDLKQNVFFFSPESFMDPKVLLELKVNNRWDIIYSTDDNFQISFIIVKGIFPIGARKVEGYYFFPVENGKKNMDPDTEKNVYALLNSLSQNYEVNNLWQFKGRLPFSDILGDETYNKWRMKNGLQIGEYLITTLPGEIKSEDAPSSTVSTVKNFTDVDDWFKNPFMNEGQLSENMNDPFVDEWPHFNTNTEMPGWPNLGFSNSLWPETNLLNPEATPLPSLDNYTWSTASNDQWSRLLFSFQLLVDQTSLTDQTFVF